MLIYKHPTKKVIIITEYRTGSTVLNNATSYSDLELFEPRDIVLSDQIFQKLHTMQTQGWQIALCIKDPIERRRSALELISLRSDSTDISNQAYYLRGFITATMNENYEDIIKNGYFNYTLNDIHLDWGTSCYYHLIVNQGIYPTLLYLDRGVKSDWSYYKSNSLYDFTEFMLNLFDEDPKAQEEFESHSNIYTKKYNQKDNLLPVSETEEKRIYLYEIYRKAITHGSYIKSWRNNQEFLYDKDILSFSEWEDMEMLLYTHMVMMINSSQELRVNSSKIVLHSVLSRLIKYYGLDKGSVLPADIGKYYPARNLLIHIPCPMDYLEHLTNT